MLSLDVMDRIEQTKWSHESSFFQSEIQEILLKVTDIARILNISRERSAGYTLRGMQDKTAALMDELMTPIPTKL